MKYAQLNVTLTASWSQTNKQTYLYFPVVIVCFHWAPTRCFSSNRYVRLRASCHVGDTQTSIVCLCVCVLRVASNDAGNR